MVCRKNGVIMLHIYGDGSCESAVDRVDVVMYFQKTCNDPVIVFRLLLRALVTHFLPFHIQCVITVSTQSFVFRSLYPSLSFSFFLVFFPFHSNGFSMPAAAVSINKSKCMWNYYPERREREKLHFADAAFFFCFLIRQQRYRAVDGGNVSRIFHLILIDSDILHKSVICNSRNCDRGIYYSEREMDPSMCHFSNLWSRNVFKFSSFVMPHSVPRAP